MTLAKPTPDWFNDGLCGQTDPEVFFPEKGGSTKDAKTVCLACPVRVQCLTWAMKTDQRFGVWGGLSERERRRLRLQAAEAA
jgi:WhiB family redox-sensing transcriptional regulator